MHFFIMEPEIDLHNCMFLLEAEASKGVGLCVKCVLVCIVCMSAHVFVIACVSAYASV